jgi:hypothetical protein
MIFKTMQLMIRNLKVQVCFITFMLEDDQRLSLGMLVHVKCMHELWCSLYDICMICEVSYMFYIDFWGCSTESSFIYF